MNALDFRTGWQNLLAMLAAASAAGVSLSQQIEALHLDWLPEWVAPLAVVVTLGAAYLTGNLKDQNGDGVVDDEDRRIAARRIGDGVRDVYESTRGPLIAVMLGLGLSACGALQSNGPIVDSRGEYFELRSTFETAVDGGCSEALGCDLALDAPGELALRAGTDVCASGFCTHVGATVGAALLVEGGAEGVPRTYGSGVVCLTGEVFGLLDKLLMLAGGRTGADLLGELVSGNSLCVEVGVEPQ